MTQENKISNSIMRMLLLSSLLATILLTGCALTPTVANIDIPTVANPTSGPAVKIVSVEDKRDFGPFVSGQCDQPSVEGDYHDKALTSRVFGRQGCKYERANVMLPEGQTVASLMSEVVANAFKEAGYRVVAADSAGDDIATVKIEILKLWAGANLTLTTTHEFSVNEIALSVGSNPKIQIGSEIRENVFFSSLGDIPRINQKGLDQLKENAVTKIKLAAHSSN